MDDIQRWDFFAEVGINEPVRYLHLEAVKGRYVTYADHVAAVAAAQREGANQGYLNGVATNADNSFKAGVKAAREAVAAVSHDYYCASLDEIFNKGCNCPVSDALDVIDALRGVDHD